jgi:hypothetical protein
MNVFMRKCHRWVAWAFILSVIATSIALAQKQPIVWMSYVPLLPLALLSLSGLYMLLRPHFTKGRDAATH